MPLVESDAIILRSRAYGEADKLVSFFCRGRGRLRGLAPSARRSRRRFGAALEPLSHVRLWFYERETSELVRLSQAELVEANWETRGELERSLALGQVVELAELLLPEREPADRAFRLLLAVLEGFKRGESLWLPLTYFQLWMTRLAGWLPALDTCGGCRRPLGEEPAYASIERGLLVCRRCRRSGLRQISPASRADALAMLGNPLRKLPVEGWDRRRVRELGRYLLDVIEYHSEKKLTTRELLDEKA